MSIFDDFSNKWNAYGQNTLFGTQPKKKKRPQTMQEWGTYVDGLSRPERDQQYPGMHKDLIPSYEMITGGDPNWGAATGTGMPTGVGAFGEGVPNGDQTGVFARRAKTDEEIEREHPACPRLKQEARNLHDEFTSRHREVNRVGQEISNKEAEIARLERQR